MTSEYYPCRFVKSYKLSELPENIKIVEEDVANIREEQHQENLSTIESLTDVQRQKFIQIALYIRTEKSMHLKEVEELNPTDQDLLLKEYNDKRNAWIDFELPKEIQKLDSVGYFEVPKILKFVKENF